MYLLFSVICENIFDCFRAFLKTSRRVGQKMKRFFKNFFIFFLLEVSDEIIKLFCTSWFSTNFFMEPCPYIGYSTYLFYDNVGNVRWCDGDF